MFSVRIEELETKIEQTKITMKKQLESGNFKALALSCIHLLDNQAEYETLNGIEAVTEPNVQFTLDTDTNPSGVLS